MKTSRFLFGCALSTGALLALAGAAPTFFARASTRAPAPWHRVTSFTSDFERGDFSGWSEQEAARRDAIQIVAAPVRRGRYAARFTVRPGERATNGNRAELLWDNGDRPGSEGWYAWSFWLPPDGADVEWKPGLWQCLGQWHDQPNSERGETWDDFPGHSPSIAVYYVWKKGVSSVELWYGTYAPGTLQEIIARAPIRKGRWNDLVFHVGWSQGADGFIEAWLDGKPFTQRGAKDGKIFGANMWNDAPHYLKIGLYRSSEIKTVGSVCFDEVRIGNSYREVAAASTRISPKP